MTAQTMTTKYYEICLIYEIRWECEEEKYFHENYKKDFPLVKNLSDWTVTVTVQQHAQWSANGIYSTERPVISSYFWASFPKICQRGYNTLLRSPKTGKIDRYHLQTGTKHGYICTTNWLLIKRQELEAQELYSKTHDLLTLAKNCF